MQEDLRNGDDLDAGREGSGIELSVADQHPADSATDQQQRAVDLSMLGQVEAELDDVERALQKLDDGSYGTCEACGKPIEPERLEAQPATRFCLDDQGRSEAEHRAHVATTETAEDASESSSAPI
jgi:RNA polymerase-binding transcription factor DksA